MSDSLRLQLPPSVNERANVLLIESIARYPQTFESAPLIAEAVVNEMDASRTGIGIRELARMKPDGEFVMPIVHRIHERFGIPYRPDAIRLADLLEVEIRHALGYLGCRTIEAAKQSGKRPLQWNPDELFINAASYSIPLVSRAYSTHLYLRQNPDVRSLVREKIKSDADELRAASRDRQRAMQHKVT